MEIILRQDVDELGLEGDIVNVAKGYARNYLIPKGVALEASPQNIKALESQRKKIEIKKSSPRVRYLVSIEKLSSFLSERIPNTRNSVMRFIDQYLNHSQFLLILNDKINSPTMILYSSFSGQRN